MAQRGAHHQGNHHQGNHHQGNNHQGNHHQGNHHQGDQGHQGNHHQGDHGHQGNHHQGNHHQGGHGQHGEHGHDGDHEHPCGETSGIPGEPRSTKSRVLEAGASMVQDFTPVKQICAHLNAFHVYANDPTRCVEANHYCTHLTEDMRQCLIYDSPNPNARLIGVEYMVSPRIFKTLPEEERKLWHTHEFEVKSGMLIMPAPAGVPTAAWEAAETAEMADIAPIYGKTWHLWQVDRGDPVPMGQPQLMGSLTSPEEAKLVHPQGLDGLLKERDQRFGVDYRQKAKKREGIEPVEKHPDADWKKST